MFNKGGSTEGGTIHRVGWVARPGRKGGAGCGGREWEQLGSVAYSVQFEQIKPHLPLLSVSRAQVPEAVIDADVEPTLIELV